MVSIQITELEQVQTEFEELSDTELETVIGGKGGFFTAHHRKRPFHPPKHPSYPASPPLMLPLITIPF